MPKLHTGFFTWRIGYGGVSAMALVLQALLPDSFYQRIRRLWKRRKESLFKLQKLVRIRIGKYEISAPENHILTKVGHLQPYRNICIGVTAGFLSEKYPTKYIIDIGANIGDTAAIIASYSDNPLILVEPDDYFYQILLLNSRKLPNKLKLLKALMSDGSDVRGSFEHWGGTARFDESKNGLLQVSTLRLSEITTDDVCLVKIDADGYDFKILQGCSEWLSLHQPAVIFENEIRDSKSLEEANDAFDMLVRVGYTHFIIWDDPGMHMVSTKDIRVVNDLNRYMCKVWEQEGSKSIYSYNVLALCKGDDDVYKRVSGWYGKY